MPQISSDIGLAFELHGCPNACRHCYLGRPAGPALPLDEVRRIVAEFRQYTRPGESEPAFGRLSVATWIWEPDFADDYRRLYDLECELSDGDPPRFELLSIWRLARDTSYAAWARTVGPDTCQLTLFGTEQTNDWFYRRAGAFQDCLVATERLLEVGMRPRWQLFLTRRILPELDDLMRLVDRLQLRERVRATGGEFVIFLHTPGPDGEARDIEHLRLTAEEVDDIPAELLSASRRHFGRDVLWCTEAELIRQIEEREDRSPCGLWPAEQLWLLVRNNLDVYTNLGPMAPGWKLGSLVPKSVGAAVEAFKANHPPGYRLAHSVSARDLANRFGDPRSTRLYTDAGDLESLWLARLVAETSGGSELA
jgi:hypothetical protein